MTSPKQPRRLLLLTSKLGYQTRSFVEAAHKLGMEVVFGSDRCHQLEDPWGDQAIALKFEDADDSARRILDSARERPFDAVVSLGDRPTPTAARVCAALGLPHHPPAAAEACRDKYRSREVLRAAGLRVPRFARFTLDAEARQVAHAIGETVGYPCVLKPLALSGSRGVIRAGNPSEAAAAFLRIRALLRSPEVRVLRETSSDFIQAEEYVEGQEFAVEALVERGRLRVLAVFDKPDLLAGPFFEETIYVTPSRLEPERQRALLETLERAAQALGLYHGPVHAELRFNPRFATDQVGPDLARIGADHVGPVVSSGQAARCAAPAVWPLEIAARCIGGLCSRALRFERVDAAAPAASTGEVARVHTGAGQGGSMSLEELLIRLALGEPMHDVVRENAAAGVMMIPIPQAGIYHDVEGVEQALAVPGVTDVHITAKPEQRLTPLPEGASYLGFIFARAEGPEQVEEALRAAHAKLRFVIGAALPVV